MTPGTRVRWVTEVESLLTHLAVDGKVAASTQNQIERGQAVSMTNVVMKAYRNLPGNSLGSHDK